MEKLLTTKELAEYLKVTTGTIENWRVAGTGPKYVKAGGVRYRESDIQAWLECEER